MNRYVITASRSSVTLRFYTNSSHTALKLLYQYAKHGYKISLAHGYFEFSNVCHLITEYALS